MSDCPTCRTFAKENESLLAELQGMQQEKLKDTREKIALRGMLTRQRRQEEVARHLMAVARMWRSLCAPRASITPTGKNVEQIRVAFLNYCTGSMDERRRLLYDCVRGYALRPYDAGYGRRTANPSGIDEKGATRRVTTAYIFASEQRIDDGAGYYRMVQAKPVEWKMAAWNAAMDVEALWRTLAIEENLPASLHAWGRTEQPRNAAPPEHLFLDERKPAVEPVVQERPTLFVIEGGEQAA